MFNEPADGQTNGATQYLKCTDELFVFDIAAGIYKPKAYYKKRNAKFWKKGLPTWLSILTNVITIFVIYYARQQWREMRNTYGEIKQQTTLMQQQVEGAMAAIVTRQPGINWPDKRAYLSMALDNRGRVTGSDICGAFDLVEVSLPGEKTIGEALPRWDFCIPEMAPSQHSEKGIFLEVPRERLKGIGGIPKAIKMTGELTYFNGYSEKSESICYYVVGAFQGSKSTRAEDEIPCDRLPIEIAHYRENQ